MTNSFVTIRHYSHCSYYSLFGFSRHPFTDRHLCFFSGKIPSHVAARLTRKYWVPNFRHFVTTPPPLHPYLLLFVTIRDYSSLFVTIRQYSHYSYYSLFVTIRCSLFAIRVFQTPFLLRPFYSVLLFFFLFRHSKLRHQANSKHVWNSRRNITTFLNLPNMFRRYIRLRQ